MAEAAPLDPELEAWIRQCAADRLGLTGAQLLRITAVSTEARAHTRLVRIVAQTASRDTTLALLLKQLTGSADAPVGPNSRGRSGEPRPRLARPGTSADRLRLEWVALAAADREFRQRALPGLVAVPVLGYEASRHALLMEELDASNLRDLTNRALLRRVGRPAAVDVERAAHDAGRWLRTWHGIDISELPRRHETRAEVVQFGHELCRFLGENLGDPAWFDGLSRRLERLAGAALPATLPLGIAHGDFAPRNVLLLRDGRVAVIDMAGGMAIPVFEDVAYFGATLRSSLPRSVSQGLLHDTRAIDRLERRLVEGYFGDDPAPWAAIRLYEVLLILDKWWGTPPRLATGRRRRVMAELGGRLVDRFFRREIGRLLRLAEHEET